MNTYEKIYCDERLQQIKTRNELYDLTDRQIRDFEWLEIVDHSQLPPIVASLLREGKPSCRRVYEMLKQLNYHLNHGY